MIPDNAGITSTKTNLDGSVTEYRQDSADHLVVEKNQTFRW